MNTHITQHISSSARALLVFAFVSGTAGLAAAARDSSAPAETTQAGTRTIQVHRADGLLGLDVMSEDDKKVGDVVDFVLRLDSTPRVTHVLVMTGGFLDMGGGVRAVPAGSISSSDDGTRIEATKQEFQRAPLIGDDREAFFNDPVQVATVDEHFGATKSSEAKEDSSETKKKAAQGQGGAKDAIIYSGLARNRVIGSDGTELGTVTDAWINLESNRVPLIEINPSVEVSDRFTSSYDTRYELPSSQYEGMGEAGQTYRFAIDRGDLSDVPSVSAVDNASIEYGITFADTVMRLQVPKTGS